MGGREAGLSIRRTYMHAWHVIAAAGVSALLFAAPATASSSLVLDQQQPVVFNGGFVYAIGGQSQQMLAQTVTAGLSGDLAEVQFAVGCAPGSNLLVQIQGVSGTKPNGVVLASQLVASDELPHVVDGQFHAFDFAKPAHVTPGSTFAIVLSSTGSCGIFPGPVGDSYQGGNLFFTGVPIPPDFWVCNCEFAGAPFDLAFKTLVTNSAAQQLEDLAAAVNGVGPGTSLADKVSKAQAYMTASDVPDTCTTLSALAHEVAAQAGKKIAPEDADALMTSVDEIESTLGC